MLSSIKGSATAAAAAASAAVARLRDVPAPGRPAGEHGAIDLSPLVRGTHEARIVDGCNWDRAFPLQELDICAALAPHVGELWTLWEMVLLGLPLLVVAPDPATASRAVLTLGSLIAPVRARGHVAHRALMPRRSCRTAATCGRCSRCTTRTFAISRRRPLAARCGAACPSG
jgi:hypothetical protein